MPVCLLQTGEADAVELYIRVVKKHVDLSNDGRNTLDCSGTPVGNHIGLIKRVCLSVCLSQTGEADAVELYIYVS